MRKNILRFSTFQIDPRNELFKKNVKIDKKEIAQKTLPKQIYRKRQKSSTFFKNDYFSLILFVVPKQNENRIMLKLNGNFFFYVLFLTEFLRTKM